MLTKKNVKNYRKKSLAMTIITYACYEEVPHACIHMVTEIITQIVWSMRFIFCSVSQVTLAMVFEMFHNCTHAY